MFRNHNFVPVLISLTADDVIMAEVNDMGLSKYPSSNQSSMKASPCTSYTYITRNAIYMIMFGTLDILISFYKTSLHLAS